MASPYITATPNGESRGGVSAYATAKPNGTAAAAPKKSGGGVLGGFLHEAGKIGSNLYQDVKGAPGGLYETVLKPVAEDTINGLTWGHLGKPGNTLRAVEAQGKAAAQTVEHPNRRPGDTLLLGLALAGGAAGAAARAGAASDALTAGEGASGALRALATKPTPAPRLFQVGDETVNLHPSAQPLVRALQAGHDALVRKALAEKPDSRLARYGTNRLGGSMAETRRYQTAMASAPAHAIARAGRKLPQPAQDALRLTSEQTLPDEAIATAKREIAAGNAKDTNAAWINRLEAVKAGGYVKLDPTRPVGEQVVIDEAKHPQLAGLDEKIAKGAAARDAALVKAGELTPDQARARISEPNRVHAGASYEPPTPGKNGVPSQALIRATGYRDRLAALVEKAEARQRGLNLLPIHLGGAGDNATVARLKAGLSTANDEVNRLEQLRQSRIKPTGLVGGEGARPGRNFVSYATTEPRAAGPELSRSPGPVIGKVRNIVPKTPFTGEGLRAGIVPQDVTGMVARGMTRAYKRVATEEFRQRLARMGSDVKRSRADVLVNTQELGHPPLSDVDKALLGQRRLNYDGEAVQAEIAGHAANFRDWLEHAVPGHRDNFAADRAHVVGAPAPEGYKWVPRGLLGELGQPSAYADPGLIVRRLNDANSLITAATVYLKPGHVVTRYGTNAVANIVQGSATPRGIAQSLKLWHALSDDDKGRALAAAGQGGYSALPHEGQTRIAGFAGKGADWWARHADAPFRFNSIAYEARKAGFDTPAKFRDFLDKLEHPEGLNAAQRAKVDYVARRANREQIAYDRLNPFEKRILTRVFWFYPWISGSTRFAGNTLLEHPVKAAVMSQLGAQGAKQQALDLGALPELYSGLFKIGGSSAFPRVLDLSTINPYSTPADVGSIVGHLFSTPKSDVQLASGMFNPAIGALGGAAYGLDQYASPTKGAPVKNFLQALVSATPEAGFVNDLRGKSKTFPVHGPLASFFHLATKPAGPRTLNRAVANAAAAREAAGKGR